jgi:hypothetical protein
MTSRRRILALVSLVLFLSLPAQAGALFVCRLDGSAHSECCCKAPAPGEPAALHGECCCSHTHWDAASASPGLGLHALLAAPRMAPAGRTPPLPAPIGPRWDAAARLPADPAPPDRYLTACSLLI